MNESKLLTLAQGQGFIGEQIRVMAEQTLKDEKSTKADKDLANKVSEWWAIVDSTVDQLRREHAELQMKLGQIRIILS